MGVYQRTVERNSINCKNCGESFPTKVFGVKAFSSSIGAQSTQMVWEQEEEARTKPNYKCPHCGHDNS